MMVYEVSPNPATSDVTITPAEETTAAGNKTTTATSGATITEVNIYDQQGILKKRQKFNNQKQVKVNVSTLRTGIYFLEIADTNHRERHQLSVLR